MTKITLHILSICLCLCAAVLTANGQTGTPAMYIVNDPDGSTNLRIGAGTTYDVSEVLANKTVVKQDTAKSVVNGWIPVTFENSYGSGYIHQSRLQPIDKTNAKKLAAIEAKNSSYSLTIYALSNNMPSVFVFSDRDCGLVVKDLKADSIIMETGVPVCFQILQGDTLSFSKLYFGNYDGSGGILYSQELQPCYVIYKVYKNTDGQSDYYTEMWPKPRTVTKEKAEAIVAQIRSKIASELKGDGWLFYQLPDFHRYCEQLLTAYFSGVDATDIIEDSGCDAAICHELDIYQAFLNAYQRSKR